MGHAVSRHKTYMVSRSDKFANNSTAKRQQNIVAVTSKSSKQHGNAVNGNVRGQNQSKNKQSDNNGNMIVHENEKLKKTKLVQVKQNGQALTFDKVQRDLKTNNNKVLQEQQPKPRVQLTQPKTVDTTLATANGMLKMDANTPARTTKMPFVTTRSPQVDSIPRDRIGKPTTEYKIQSESISHNTVTVRPETASNQKQHTVNLNVGTIPASTNSRPENGVSPLNHPTVSQGISEKENNGINVTEVNPLTNISNTAFINIHMTHKRQRSEDLDDPIPYPVTFMDDNENNNSNENEIPTQFKEENVSYPMVRYESEYTKAEFVPQSEVKRFEDHALSTQNQNGDVAVYMSDKRQRFPDNAVIQSEVTSVRQIQQNETMQNNSKPTANPVKGILKTTQENPNENGTNWSSNSRLNALNANISSSMQNLHKGKPKSSSKQVTIKAPKADKKEKKVKLREKNKLMQERPKSAIFFSEEMRKSNAAQIEMMSNDSGQYQVPYMNGRPTRYISEAAIDNIAFYESKNVGRQYFVESTRKKNKAIPQMFYQQTNVPYEQTWGSPEMVQYRPYQQMGKQTRNKGLLYL